MATKQPNKNKKSVTPKAYRPSIHDQTNELKVSKITQTLTLKNKKPTTKKTTSKSTPKLEMSYYSCLRKYYVAKDVKTGETKSIKMWIVIGDGHKRYRKFSTQAESIDYFRNLKKIAQMRVQSVKSQEFVKTIYTFMELERQGINVNKIVKDSRFKEFTNSDANDFEDDFSVFDKVDNEDYKKFDRKSVDKLIEEKERSENVDDKTIVIDFELDAHEENLENEPVSFVVEQPSYEEKTTLYDLVTSELSYIEDEKPWDIQEQEQNSLKQEEINSIDDNIELTHTQTNLSSIEEDSNINTKEEINNQPHSSKKTLIYWLVVLGVALLLSAILVVAILFALNIF